MSTDVMRFKNPTKITVKLGSLGLPDVAPGGEVDIPFGVCAAKIMDNGRRGQSAIEKVAPQLEPVSKDDFEAWQKTPDPLPPRSLKVTSQARPGMEPAGVAALKAARAAQEKAKSEEKPKA